MTDSGPHAAASLAGEYEFNAEQDQIIGRTARYASAWGIVSIAIGLFGLFASLLALQGGVVALGQLPAGIANIVIGSFFVGTARSLRAVVETRGDDIAHLMQALRRLGVAFVIQLVMFVLAFVAALLLGLAAGSQASLV
jgi:hypothetical protein